MKKIIFQKNYFPILNQIIEQPNWFKAKIRYPNFIKLENEIQSPKSTLQIQISKRIATQRSKTNQTAFEVYHKFLRIFIQNVHCLCNSNSIQILEPISKRGYLLLQHNT